MKDGMLVDKRWFKLWKDWTFSIELEVTGYYEPYPELHLSMFGLHAVFVLPFKQKDTACDCPSYGIAIHHNTFWIYTGPGKYKQSTWKSWSLPFFEYILYEHCVDIKDRGYVNVKEYGDPIAYRDIESINKHTMPYIDSYDGEEVMITYWKEYRVWRRKWFAWTSVFDWKREYVEFEFSKEVGKGKGTWKGGCFSSSYDILPGETAEECVKRMEKERKL